MTMVPKGITGNFKRLIVCCDGTWMSSDQAKSSKENPTNVTRFCRAIENAEVLSDGSEIQQVVYYQKGIGTGDMGPLQKVIAGGTGFGLDQNVREAYYFLSNNYQDGDELYLFGFSRGAYTVRAISGLIGDIGLLNKWGITFFPDIYKQYQCRFSHPEGWTKYQADKDLAKYRQPNVRMRVLGCWETVGSLGIPENPIVKKLGWNKKYYFFDTQLSKSVENAFHVLALDEHRSNFVPTLWYLKPEDSRGVVPVPAPDDPNIEPPPKLPRVNLVQTWFAGVHSDVAGGGDPSGYSEQGDLTFAWMVEQCKGLLFFDPKYVRVQTAGHAGYRQKDIAKKVSSATPPSAGTDTASVKSALATSDSSLLGYAAGHLSDSFTGIFRAGGSIHRKPGQYFNDDIKGLTNETMHPSVRIRRLKMPLSWTPPSLKGFEAKEDPNSPGTWIWSKKLPNGIVVKIPEYKIEEKDDMQVKSVLADTSEGLKQPELELMTEQDKAMLEGSEPPSPIEVDTITGSFIWRMMRMLIGR